MSQDIPDNPPGSHAWCTDCGWKNATPECERLARAHGESFQHIVHVYEPEGA